ncbi:C40 family peptidase [Planomonospora sp. ID82291]|uniref:C40 family peptidase n=1 Tax=Planomonospora sp. ID82291 TaxID=2738136 RepID=UPI0018C3ACFF|nr:C40 family peptidase [Planomonospora sp. ID82291]MBG0815013.1 C40 family peptidase [Planomonospora sp. ID82291]
MHPSAEYGRLVGRTPSEGDGRAERVEFDGGGDGVFERRTRVSDVVREVCRDLAYRPRLRPGGRGRGAPGRSAPAVAVPAVAVLLVAVLAADLVVLSRMPEQAPERGGADTVAARRSADRRELARTTTAAASVPSSGVPSPAVPPPVAPLTEMRKPHLFVVANRPLSSAVVARAARIKGIRSIERADAAEVVMDDKRVQTLGVDPSTFRAYTPRPTATSDKLWRNVAAGEVAVSFVLGNDGGLALGRTVASGGRALRVGAYATMGMGAIDAVVSRRTARELGIPENNALVVSAPKADSTRLRAALLKVLPKGSQVVAINPVFKAAPRKVWPVSAFMSPDQVRTALTAAIGKLGRPYVWGAEGPDTFDCSGLVQWAYAQAGVRVPRVTHQQFVSGPQIPLSQAQPGDLLFWRHDPTNPGYVSHVAIYWGGGKMLHAPRTGDVVKLVPVSTRNFAGAVRVSPQLAARAG